MTNISTRFLSVFLLLPLLCSLTHPSGAQHSVARQWNEALLDAIRMDFARPTVHARNLFHTSIAMYDAWAAYDDMADTYLLGRTVGNYTCGFFGVSAPPDIDTARRQAVSYAAYRLLSHRFQRSPHALSTQARFDALFAELGYDASFISTDYESGSAAALGNYIAQCLIDFGLQDGANEQGSYDNQYYRPVNPPLIPFLPGNPNISDLNRWQPLALDIFIDQSGNALPSSAPAFLSPEWGRVTPFVLSTDDLTIYQRDGQEYWAYHDPGAPPHSDGPLAEEYKWGFALVAVWSSHLDPADSVLIDISPATFGNFDIDQFPRTVEGLRDFYDLTQGGDPGVGRQTNPHSGQPYEKQWVPRGDYTRVLAEFWADGPDSETPPGHWYTLLNYVNDHPAFSRRFAGAGALLDHLEWDVKAYFVLGGALHDAAIAAWGIKGWYDYIRPISAIRAMADRGQSSDPNLPSYAPDGIPLFPGFIEVVDADDPLAGTDGEEVGKIKLYAWRGPSFIDNPFDDVAGVGWILAEDWWPYQRPSFVTPPFAGYISGHSTFSRAAAEVLTLLTGDEYFPGGLGQFHAPKNEFLIFEDGPSVDVTLQWATYRDASDQTSLSRIWGGIHPPVDDIPGRLIGAKIGIAAFQHASFYFTGQAADLPGDHAPVNESETLTKVYPNPLLRSDLLSVELDRLVPNCVVRLYNALGQVVYTRPLENRQSIDLNLQALSSGIYFVRISGAEEIASHPIVIFRQ